MISDEIRRFQDTMNRMFEELWGVPAPGRLLLPPGERAIEKYERPFADIRKPFVDLVETDKEIIATVEMPGLEKEDIKINLTEDKIEISSDTRHEVEKQEKGYVYKERRSGSYYRAISLPSPIDSENSKASYNNGVLEIKMPKTEIKKKTPVKVE